MMKSLKALMLVGVLSMASTMTSMANWEQQTGGQWKYQNTDGSYAVGWQWLDGNGDGVAECYYLGTDGTMAVSTVIDGYTVNADGAWTIDGVVQTKVASGSGGQSNSSQPTTNRHPDGLPIATIDSGTWEAECGDSTGLPPMQSGTGNNNQSDNNDISWGDPNETGSTDVGWGVDNVKVGG